MSAYASIYDVKKRLLDQCCCTGYGGLTPRDVEYVLDTVSTVEYVVSKDAYDQAKWENEVMQNQLAEINKTLGQKMDDVVTVVRCKDCLFWNRERISCEGLARCVTGEGGVRYRHKNDFCSRGRKMDGET